MVKADLQDIDVSEEEWYELATTARQGWRARREMPSGSSKEQKSSHPCDVIALWHHTDPGGVVGIDGLQIPE